MSKRGLLRVIAGPMIATALTAGGMLAQATPAFAATTTTHLPWTTPLMNMCTGDLVSLTGDFQMVTGETIDGNGDVHIILMQHGADLKGFGDPLFGSNPYVASFTDNTITELDLTGATTDQEAFHENLISRGTEPSFKFHYNIRVVNGVPTVDHIDSDPC